MYVIFSLCDLSATKILISIFCDWLPEINVTFLWINFSSIRETHLLYIKPDGCSPSAATRLGSASPSLEMGVMYMYATS